MNLKEIKHHWEVDKIIREANIQNFTETGQWHRGPEPHMGIIERTIEALLDAGLATQDLAAENNKLAKELLEQIEVAIKNLHKEEDLEKRLLELEKTVARLGRGLDSV